jgi:hypothetical protein
MSFKEEIVASLKVKDYNFEDVVRKAHGDAEAHFNNGAREAVVTEGHPTSETVVC